MADLKGIVISDLLGASAPAVKLIDTVASCIGTLYEPIHIRRMARARAEELSLISAAINDNINLPMEYRNGELTIDTTQAEELMQRTGNRLLFQEMRKQQNIDAVVANAYKELEAESEVSSMPVDTDWLLRFFDSIQDISNERMQEIWGKILAGEVKRPTSYSLRMLEKLRNITQAEAELFRKVATLVLKSSGSYFLITDDKLINEQGLFFSNILTLEECGLINAQHLSLSVKVSRDEPNYILSDKVIGVISSSEKEITLKLSVFVLTESGKELHQAIGADSDAHYVLKCMEKIQAENPKFNIKAHKVLSRDDSGSITYHPADILPSNQDGSEENVLV